MSTNHTTACHIGPSNILAVSGGAIVIINRHTIGLPVHYGYSVEVEYLAGPDLYEVRRVWRRGTSVKVKGTESRLYADQVGDAAYRASCFRDPFGNEPAVYNVDLSAFDAMDRGGVA